MNHTHADIGGATARRVLPLAIVALSGLVWLSLRGETARLLGVEIPIPVVAFSCIVMASIVWITTEQSYRRTMEVADREKALRGALAALRKSHEELKSTQLQLIQSAKLESVGRLAAGVAHEVKNPLAIILAASDYLARNLPTDDPNLATICQDLQDAVRRADSVIGGLLNYSAASDLRPTTEDPNAVVEQALLLVRHQLTKQHVNVVKTFAEGLPNVMIDKPKIEQVLINLFINAIDAMGPGGTLTVRTSKTQLREPGRDIGYRQSDPFRVGQTVVVVDIEDTGPGIDSAHLSRIFDPFFTTKGPGKGTGLGLAVSRMIVALHGGTISIGNREEGGARATLTFKSVRF